MATQFSSGALRPFILPLLLLLAFLTQCATATQTYCSSENTATDQTPASWTWQSNGWCNDHCPGYAFAIVQADNCWCSNVKPSKTVDVGKFCNQTCPGFPDDLCGDKDAGYFGYIAIPGGSTVEASTKTTTSAATTTATSTRAYTPVTSLQVITVSGAIVTQTVTNAPTAPSEAISQTGKSESVSTGKIAGAAVGGVAGFALILGLLFFFLRRLRSSEHHEDLGGDSENASRRTSPRRNVSVLSKMGLLEKVHAVGNGSGNRNSVHTGDSAGISTTSDRRSSHPMFYDQRLNPNALMEHDNGSRVSVMTMQDNRDYTRTLGVRNPDPRPSFEG